MPAGLDVTVPEPALETVSALELEGTAAKLAVTVVSWVKVTEQLPVPLQAPLQPENKAPEVGVAVRVTVLPAAIVSLQSLPQLMPAGVEAMLPDPEVEVVRTKVCVPPPPASAAFSLPDPPPQPATAITSAAMAPPRIKLETIKPPEGRRQTHFCSKAQYGIVAGFQPRYVSSGFQGVPRTATAARSSL